MNNQLDNEITPEKIKRIRTDRGLTQADFWGAIGVNQPTGSKYEAGSPMPDPVRRLLAIHYLADIPTNAPAEALLRLGALARAGSTAERNLRRAQNLIQGASLKLATAMETIGRT